MQERFDWFDSREIIAYAVLAGMSFYMFLAHSLTTDQSLVAAGV